MLKNKLYFSKLENFQTRKKNLIKFLKSIANLDRVSIVEISNWSEMDEYAQDPEYDGLVVSQETYDNALKLNETRIKKGLNPLILIVIPILKDKNNKKISSTSIREKIKKKILL